MLMQRCVFYNRGSSNAAKVQIGITRSGVWPKHNPGMWHSWPKKARARRRNNPEPRLMPSQRHYHYHFQKAPHLCVNTCHFNKSTIF